jgi:hypothetical protein
VNSLDKVFGRRGGTLLYHRHQQALKNSQDPSGEVKRNTYQLHTCMIFEELMNIVKESGGERE